MTDGERIDRLERLVGDLLLALFRKEEPPPLIKYSYLGEIERLGKELYDAAYARQAQTSALPREAP